MEFLTGEKVTFKFTSLGDDQQQGTLFYIMLMKSHRPENFHKIELNDKCLNVYLDVDVQAKDFIDHIIINQPNIYDDLEECYITEYDILTLYVMTDMKQEVVQAMDDDDRALDAIIDTEY